MSSFVHGFDHSAPQEHLEGLRDSLGLPTEREGKLLLGPRTPEQMSQDLPLREAERPLVGHTLHPTRECAVILAHNTAPFHPEVQ